MPHEHAFQALVLALSCVAACSDPLAPPPNTASTAPRLAIAVSRPTVTAEAPRPAVAADLQEAGFRDPFRSFAPTLAAPPTTDGEQLLGDLALADLRLLAVVVSAHEPVAMVTDPSGFGTTLRRGMFVGRPEIVHRDDVEYAVRWRVARITSSHLRRDHEGRLTEAPAEMVFERADPTGSGLPTERSLTIVPPQRERLPGSFRLASTDQT